MSYMTMGDEIHALRTDRSAILDELKHVKAKHDALAAHVERLKQAGNATDMCTFGINREAEIWFDVCEETPETSLERLKAQWQAEALDDEEVRILFGMIEDGLDETAWEQAKGIILWRDELRRLAGGDV